MTRRRYIAVKASNIVPSWTGWLVFDRKDQLYRGAHHQIPKIETQCFSSRIVAQVAADDWEERNV